MNTGLLLTALISYFVIVDPDTINDEASWNTARNIAKKIEEELTYPGEVKVTLLREIRCIEYAR